MKNTVLITGAANGIGKATALRFAENGWQVLAADLDEKGLDQVSAITGITPFLMDITSDDSVRKAFDRISSNGTVLHMIVNVAGIDRYFPFSEAPVVEFKNVFEVNLFGAYRVNQVFLPILKKPGGIIIHIGSESLRLTLPFMPYPISKKALESYSKSLRQEMKFLGIRVVTIRPGAVHTDFIKNLSGIGYPVKHPLLASGFERFAAQAAGEVGKVIEPAAVASLIFRISGTANPRAVYRINNSLKLRMMTMVPFKWIEKMVYRRLSR